MFAGIRSATSSDSPALRQIERDAGERFRDVGLADIADHDPPSEAALAQYEAGGRSWVAVDEAGAPVGYVLADEVDDNAHIEQVSVRPDHQGQGIGRALIDRVGAWAAAGGRSALTLSTFSDVPWNAPLYRHLGFRDLTPSQVGPELQARCAEEARFGLDPATRVCMRLDQPA